MAIRGWFGTTLDELLRSRYRKSLALSGLSPADIEPLVTAYTPTQAERDALVQEIVNQLEAKRT